MAIARGLAAGTGFLIRLTGKFFGAAQKRGGAAMADFRARPEHARWRAYAVGSYIAILAGTAVAQLYTTNPIEAYVRKDADELGSFVLFVRNDSRKDWKDTKLTLNGIYSFAVGEMKPGANKIVPVSSFAVNDGASGKPVYAPKKIVPKQLAIDCDRGHLEVELTP
jgi:hypothetical protein